MSISGGKMNVFAEEDLYRNIKAKFDQKQGKINL